MKKILSVLLLTLISNLPLLSLSSEDDIIHRMSEGMDERLKTKEKNKIGVFSFLNLKSEETPEGKRIANKLLMELQKKNRYVLVDRSQIQAALKEQGLNQTGVIDPRYSIEAGKILPVQIMIRGVVVSYGDYGELTIKAVDSETGELYYSETSKFIPQDKFSYEDNQSRREQYAKNTKKWDDIENAYLALCSLYENRPKLFLVTVMDQNDIQNFRKNNPQLTKEIRHRVREFSRNHPEFRIKRKRIQRALEFMKEDRPSYYEDIMNKKASVIRKITNNS